MRREGRLGGRPTSRTRPTGKCKRSKCRGCHTLPTSKSQGKAKGESKIKIRDVTVNYLMHDWPACDKKQRRTLGLSSLMWLKAGTPSTMWTDPDYGREDMSDWSESDGDGEEGWDDERASNETTPDLVISLVNAVASHALAVHPDGCEMPAEMLSAGDLASDSKDSDEESEYEKLEAGDEVMSESDDSWCAVNVFDTLSNCTEASEGDDEAWLCF